MFFGKQTVSRSTVLNDLKGVNGECDVSDGANGTYYYYFSPLDIICASMQIILGGGGTKTLTIEATPENDIDSSLYPTNNMTNDMLGGASITASVSKKSCGSVIRNYQFARVKIVITGASNDAEYKIFWSPTY